MPKVALYRIAHGRSGDKGDASNVGLIANTPEAYEAIRREATEERVKDHFREVCRGRVERFEIPNLLAFNYILHDSLGGGGTESLKTDAQGKTHAQGLLQMEIDVPDDVMATAAPERLAWRERRALRDAGALGDGGAGGVGGAGTVGAAGGVVPE